MRWVVFPANHKNISLRDLRFSLKVNAGLNDRVLINTEKKKDKTLR